jgi:serine/threonine protein kinase/tetratricopeptide (TPR) repeat protein
MTPEPWQQLKSLFHAALELASEDRAAFLVEACDGNNELRAQVERLLVSHDEAGPFLVLSALADVGVVVAEDPVRNADKNDRVGQLIGPYEIICEIGHGGMGTVFLAVRADDQYRKQVAIKIVNRGMDTEAILRRFVMERQILANLEHPNIAHLLEGGTTQDGLPYFVMEYIEGESINQYCDARTLTTAQRLELFLQVCAALQYAHQNLVVHRDIKPSNILITAEGVPKLLDFGIAKLLSPAWAAEASEATASMLRLMTPEYASPEQLRGLPITTASDVYSLGVVLYQLLCGHRPFQLSSRHPEEAVRVILEEEPPKPSVAVTRTEEVRVTESTVPFAITPESVGQAREGTVDKLRRRLSGDLDNIVLKALRKEPERRYASVLELERDIRRHLAGLPVSASPDTYRYLTGKFVRRNKAVVLAAALVVITLITATGITAWQARVARRERDKAQSRFNQVRKLANKVVFEYNDGIEKLEGSTPVREKMVKDASTYLDVLSQESGGDPGLQNELASAYQKLGDVQGGTGQASLGDRDGAIKSYRKALAILESLMTKEADQTLLLNIAGLHGKLNLLLWNMGQQAEAQKQALAALTIREQLAASQPANLTYKLALARSYRDFGAVLSSKTEKDTEGAIAYYRRSNEMCASITEIDPTNLEARAIAGLGYRRLGAEFEIKNDSSQALACYRKALSLTEERVGLDPNNAQLPVVLADCWSNIGRALMLQHDDSGALENFNRALTILKPRFDKDPTNAQLLMNLSQTYNNLGNAMAQVGKFTEALANYQEALRLREGYIKDHPIEIKPRLGETTFDLGDLYAQMASDNHTSAKKRTALWLEAKSWYQRSLDIWQQLSTDGTLPGYQNQKPDETAKAIARCDAALAELSVR